MSRRNPEWRGDDRRDDDEEEYGEGEGHRREDRHRNRHHRHRPQGRQQAGAWMDSTSLRIIGAIGALTILAAIVGIGVVANNRMSLDHTFNQQVAKLKKDCFDRKMMPVVDTEQGVFFCAKEIDSVHSLR